MWRAGSEPSGSMGPFSPRLMDHSTELQSLTRKRGCDPESASALPRHTRLQDACSIDLTYSEQELDQEN